MRADSKYRIHCGRRADRCATKCIRWQTSMATSKTRSPSPRLHDTSKHQNSMNERLRQRGCKKSSDRDLLTLLAPACFPTRSIGGRTCNPPEAAANDHQPPFPDLE